MSKVKDLTGQKFGKLTVIKRNGSKKGRAAWLCKCDCGNYVTVVGYSLTGGHTRSCGCIGFVKDITGQKFGRLTAIREDGRQGRKALWLCKCDCGNYITVLSHSLISGNTKSCGCLNDEKRGHTKHGETAGGEMSRLYRIWAAMKQRAENPNNYSYKNYGERGISVCKEWHEYENFRDWALKNGYKENLSIDRIDVNGNYCPENCRWADNYMQGNNRRDNHFVTYNGKTQTISQWAREFSVNQQMLRYRINAGWDMEKALTTPSQRKR